MDLQGQPPAVHQPEDAETSIAMSPSAHGPVDPHDFYLPHNSSMLSESNTDPASAPAQSVNRAPHKSSLSQSRSQVPLRGQSRSVSNFAEPGAYTSDLPKSVPVALPSRHAGNVKDLANRINREGAGSTLPLPVSHNSRDRYRRLPIDARGSTTGLRTPKIRTGQSPHKTASMSFDSTFSNGALSQDSSAKAHIPRKSMTYGMVQPLFGEITADGRWKGNFDIYEPLPAAERARRRGSDGSLALQGRSISQNDMFRHSLQRHSDVHELNHKRSRSELSASQTEQALRSLVSYSIDTFQDVTSPGMFRSTESPQTHTTPNNRSSRIPVRARQASYESFSTSSPYSRPQSAMSTSSGAGRPAKSPSRGRAAGAKENTTPSSTGRNRYNQMQISPSQPMAAKILVPPQPASPPLRSSRPRQPVSAATTSASRARAAERFHQDLAKDKRAPSEQWLGKPYDPQQERSRRKIPELQKIDFEERRARIQRAISQNLESTRSQERLRSKSRGSQSRSLSRGGSRLGTPGPDDEPMPSLFSNTPTAEQVQHDVFNEGENSQNVSDGKDVPARALRLDTSGLPVASAHDSLPSASHTIIEDDSPLTEAPLESAPTTPVPSHEQTLTLLTPATYKPPGKLGDFTLANTYATLSSLPSHSFQEGQSSLITESNALLNEQRRQSVVTSHAGMESDSNVATVNQESGLSAGTAGFVGDVGDQGSIRIMLDDPINFSPDAKTWYQETTQRVSEFNNQHAVTEKDQRTILPSHHANMSEPLDDSYAAPSAHSDSSNLDRAVQTATATPRKRRRDTLKGTAFHPDSAYVPPNDSLSSDATVARALHHYQSTGTLTEDMLQEMQQHVDLDRLSANGGSNAFMIQSLLDSVLGSQMSHANIKRTELLMPNAYAMPSVTAETPTGESFEPGTVLIYNRESAQSEEAEDFEASISRADAEWERQRRGYENNDVCPAENRPPPPPKDIGYTPRSSASPLNATFPMENYSSGMRLSSQGHLDVQEPHSRTGSPLQDLHGLNTQVSNAMTDASTHGPPTPLSPPEPILRQPFSAPDFSAAAFADNDASDLAPSIQKSSVTASMSSRPSFDSQQTKAVVPASQSMTSLGDPNTRQNSMDTADDREKATKLLSPSTSGPEHKRLSKRRHIIKELIDTENTYHQDLKIIEDIYKATCTPELVAPEDKKTLFGNCDEVEKFALHFYDEMRKAVAQVYVPSKSSRWGTKRNSFSTTQSDGTTNAFTDAVDDEKDRTSTVGAVFIANLVRMEQIYGSYLKNHDAANQRLAALQGTPTVKCWLDECHANASDITSAWDLDSLLVKPTQRVAKYPMLLQQLLDTTPSDHPDHENIKTAAKDSIGMLTRINDAKKRADLVDSIVNNRRRKESDLGRGIVKAFGRRTDRLKERVGLQEAFQDPEFDDLAHKFGGHFIRLQICMRDVQDYMNRTDKAVELINNYASALELFTDVSPSTLPEIESKWRRYGQTIRDLNLVAFTEHKTNVQKRVLAPMIACIKLHEGPENAIAKRKKRIVDFARVQADEKRGVKSDKKTLEAAEIYTALNDQLKIELPKLYSLTATLVQRCLHCFLDIQLQWNSTWERKLRPLLEAADIPADISQIEPAFRADYGEYEKRCMDLTICNGSLMSKMQNMLSPQPSAEYGHDQSKSRTSLTVDHKRTMSMGSDSSANPTPRRHSGIYNNGLDAQADQRLRSDSQLSARQLPYQTLNGHRPWSNSTASNTPASSSFSASRPNTATNQSYQTSQMPRQSMDVPRSPRPVSGGTAYFTPRLETDNTRFSGIFSSAVPPDLSSQNMSRPPSPPKAAPSNMPVLFVCASLFEFSIDKTRREGGYPYLTYVQGEVFDVIAQKGELWLAKNQDDGSNQLGWIWEQHFVILSTES